MTADKQHNCLIKTFGLLSQEPMSRYTSFRVGGPADLLGLPRDKQALAALLAAAREENMPVTILGGGTNTLVSDKGIRGLVIVLEKLKSVPRVQEASPNIEPQNNKKTIIADAGERLSTVVRFAMDQGLSGLESAAGIPGTLGGAIMMNAGIPSWEISQVIAAVEVMDTKKLSCRTIERKDLTFSYRRLCLEDAVIVKAHLCLTKAATDTIQNTFNHHLKTKKATQPISFASAGCFFKNPAGLAPAGKLIEDAGLKGKQVNGAQVSPLHANFIVNAGNARCEDILALKRLVQKTVFEKFNIKLETEVKVTGE